MRRLIAVLTIATGCSGISQNDFIVDYEVLHCQGYAVCASDEMARTVFERECLSFLRFQEYPVPPECLYDAEAAEACVDALAIAGCSGVDPEYPDVCLDVYSRCPYPRMPEVGDDRRL